MGKKTTAELSKGRTPVSEMPLHRNLHLQAANSLKNNTEGQPWIRNRVSDHDKSQREKGRH